MQKTSTTDWLLKRDGWHLPAVPWGGRSLHPHPAATPCLPAPLPTTPTAAEATRSWALPMPFPWEKPLGILPPDAQPFSRVLSYVLGFAVTPFSALRAAQTKRERDIFPFGTVTL